MTRVTRLSRCDVVVLAAIGLTCLLFPSGAHAQGLKEACSGPGSGVLFCAESLFSTPPVHLTFSSLPPPNGLPLGVVYERDTDYLSSPFRALPDSEPSVRSSSTSTRTPITLNHGVDQIIL